MAVATVVDVNTQVRYTLDRTPLGEGATARVWRGRATDRPGEPAVAVKIAHYGLSQAALVEFEAELDLLERLHATPARDAVPWAHRGVSDEDRKAAIIIMELIPDEWQLARLAGARGRLDERTALETAVLYLGLLVELHTLGYATRGDRKASDLRYDREQRRLVVLDWNRAAAFPDAGNGGTRDEWVRQDLRGFGRLWAERALGRTVLQLPGVDQVDDAAWAELTRGFRRVLVQCSGARPGGGYTAAADVLRDLQAQLTWLQNIERDPEVAREELRQALARLMAQGRQAAGPAEALDIADEVLTLVDLAERAGMTADELAAACGWAAPLLSLGRAAGNEASKRVEKQLRDGYYQEAADLADQLLKDTAAPHEMEALPLVRLAAVANLAAAGTRQNLDVRKVVAELLAWLRETWPLANGEVAPGKRQDQQAWFQARGSQLAATHAALPAGLRPALWPLLNETQIRAFFAAPVRAYAQPDEGLALWRSLRETDPRYAEALRRDLPELEQALAADAANDAVRALADAQRRAFEDRVQAVRDRLGPGADIAWPELGAELTAAATAYRALQRIPAGVDGPSQTAYQLVAELREMARAFDAGDVVGGWQVAAALSPLLPDADRAAVRDLARGLVQREVEHLCQTPPFWPDAYDRAQQLVREAGIEDAQLEQLLAEWGSDLAHWRELLGLTGAPDLAGRLFDLDAAGVDQALAEAAALECEVIDRRRTPDGDPAGWTVAALQDRRRLLRMQGRSDELVGRVAALAEGLNGLGARLTAAADVNAQLGALDAALAETTATLAALRTRLGAPTNAALDAANQLQGKLQSTAKALQDAEPQLTRLRDRLVLAEKAIGQYEQLQQTLAARRENASKSITDLQAWATQARQRLDVAEKDLKEIVQREQALQAQRGPADQTLARILFQRYYVQALGKARLLLNKDLVEPSVNQAVYYAKRIAAEPEIQAAQKVLQDLLRELQELGRNPEAKADLMRMRRELERENADTAAQAYRDFCIAAEEDETLIALGLAEEMRQEMLQLRARQAAARNSAGKPGAAFSVR